MSELKECPFCGGNTAIFPYFREPPERHERYVVCAKCMACSDCYDSERDAISAWNTRATDATIAAILSACESVPARMDEMADANYDAGNPAMWQMYRDHAHGARELAERIRKIIAGEAE